MSLFFVFPFWTAFAEGCALAKAWVEFERAEQGFEPLQVTRFKGCRPSSFS
jgi:hypothetical protein